MSTEISAVICTRNQADYLAKSLASLASQTLQEENFEILVIDNGSTDNTKQVVRSFKRSKNLRYIYEPIVGLSQARNTGWKNASGRYVAYLDDDAIANPNWLQKILEKFYRVTPSPMSVGGKILPIWESERPEWLVKEMETYIGIINWSEKSMFLTDDRFYLSGSNLAYSRRILEDSKGFSTQLGRKGHSLLSNEEILLQRYLRKHNHPIWYDPDICVRHHVKPQCLKKRWYYRRYYWQGVSDAILEYQMKKQDGNPWSYRSLVFQEVSYLFQNLGKSIRTGLASKNLSVIDICWTYHWLGRLVANTRIAIGRT